MQIQVAGALGRYRRPLLLGTGMGCVRGRDLVSKYIRCICLCLAHINVLACRLHSDARLQPKMAQDHDLLSRQAQGSPRIDPISCSAIVSGRRLGKYLSLRFRTPLQYHSKAKAECLGIVL